MATWYFQGVSNWGDADAWNSEAGGGGTSHTYTVPEPSNTFDLNNYGPILDMDVVIGTLVSNGASGVLYVQATRSITGNVVCTAGLVLNVTSGTLTINGQVSTSGSASTGVVINTTGSLVVNNPSGVALDVQKGTGLNASGTGGFEINGAINVNAASAYGVQSSCTGASSINGAVTLTTGTGAVRVSGATPLTISGEIHALTGTGLLITNASAVVNLTDCSLSSSPSTPSVSCYAINISNGTINWTGAATLAAGEECYCQVTTGTINLGTAGSALTLSNSGQFTCRQQTGTIDGTYATVNNLAATGQATFPGVTNKPTIVPYSSGGGLAIRIGESF